MQQSTPLTITNEHMNLLSVSGRLDGAGRREGWLRLVVPGNSVVTSVDETALPAALPMDPAPTRADHMVGQA